MLKTILSISGKPGLFKLVSHGKNMLIVESLADKKRVPAYAKDKVISLGDIAIYTNEAEVPLHEVLTNVKNKENGQQASVSTSAKPDELRAYFAEILPNFDRADLRPAAGRRHTEGADHPEEVVRCVHGGQRRPAACLQLHACHRQHHQPRR